MGEGVSTADLCDRGHAAPVGGHWIRYGGVPAVDGTVQTVRVGDSNRAVR